jgi:hypothetical protein
VSGKGQDGTGLKILKSAVRKIVSVLFESFGPIRVLFYVKNEIGFINQAPLLKLMENNPVFKVAVVKSDPQTKFSDFELQSLIVRNSISEKKARYQVWHYVISTDKRYFWLTWNSIGVHLAHGSAVGNGFRSKAEQKFWFQQEAERNEIAIIILPGPGIYQSLIERSPLLHADSKKAFLLAGNPKLSGLAERKYDRTSILTKLGLDPDRKTVLISSHWSKMSLLRDLDAATVQLIHDQHPELNIIVTAHPKLWTLKTEKYGFDGQALLSKLQLIANNNSDRMALSLTGKPFELLSASDVLLCDHSSIRVEYSLLNRPAGLYRNPDFICESQTTDDLYRRSSEVFHDYKTLEFALTKILSPDYENQAANRELRDFFLTDPTRSAEKILGFLTECGKVSSPKSNRWAKVKRLERLYLEKALEPSH